MFFQLSARGLVPKTKKAREGGLKIVIPVDLAVTSKSNFELKYDLSAGCSYPSRTAQMSHISLSIFLTSSIANLFSSTFSFLFCALVLLSYTFLSQFSSATNFHTSQFFQVFSFA